VQGQKAELKDLLNLVSPHYAVAWKELGRELGLPIGFLNTLQKDHSKSSDTCCDKMLEEWRNVDAGALWVTVLKALDSFEVTAVINSYSNPNILLEHSEVDMQKAISIVADRLQDCSKISRHSKSEEEWPPYQPNHFTSIALIHHKKGLSTKKEITFVASMQHKGKVYQSKLDSHVTQTSNEFSEVFSKIESIDQFPNTILIEGAPGIGKTTLCKEIVFQWSDQKLLEDKRLVVLVFLRDPLAQSIKSLKEFVRYYCNYTEKGNSVIEEYIHSTAGKDIAIVLDGYDELPEDIRKNSELFFINLVHQRIRTDLSQCTVVITSRLNVSDELHDIADRRVEILGFTENNRKDYIKQALEDNESIEKLLSYLERNPAINAYCYIPLNMTILLCLFTEGEKNSELPATQTEINKTFICVTISRFIKKTQNPRDCGISSFEHIPKEYEQIFNDLCRLAYKALRDDRIVFGKHEIQNYSCKHLARAEHCHGLGLLKAVEFYSTKENVKSLSYNFLHLSLQETLAAYYIKRSGSNKETKLLKSKFMDSRYFNMWIMYVGLTKGQSLAFKHFLSGNNFKLVTLISLALKKSAKISKEFISDKVKCLHLFQCFSEAENDEMSKYVGELLKDGKIDLSGQVLNAVNIHTLGLFLDRSSTKDWKLLNLNNCYLGTFEIEQLFKFGSKNVSIDCLDLSYNNLTESSAGILAELILTWKVKKLILMHDEKDNYEDEHVVNSTLMELSNLKVINLQTEIKFAANQSILAFCKHCFKQIINLNISMNYRYSNVYLLACQLGSKYHEVSQVVNFLARISTEGIHLFDCEVFVSHILEAVMINNEVSSFHITMKKSSTISTEISSAVRKLAEFAVILGEDNLPLHAFNMSGRSFTKQMIQENACGTFVFKNCIDENIYDILSYCISRQKLVSLVLKQSIVFQKVIPLLRKDKLVLLQSLILFHCKLRMEDVALTCGALVCINLVHLNLSGNYISNSAAEILANGITSFLQHLELADCNLREEGLALICSTIKDRNLLTLDLSGDCITDQIACILANAILNSCCMEYLHLSRSLLQCNGIKMLVSALVQIKSLRSLDLSCNKLINACDSHDLAAVIFANRNLEHLDLSYCDISLIKDSKTISMRLKEINFAGNYLTDLSFAYFKEFISIIVCLQYLSLSKCCLQEHQVIEVLKNVSYSLRFLDLSYNVIPDKAAKSVADVIYNNTDLEHLNLSNCQLQEEGLLLILKEIKSARGLKYLNIQHNPVKSELLASELAMLLTDNYVLKWLSLSNCTLKEEGFCKIVEALTNTNSLIYFDIGSNYIPNVVANKLANTNLFLKKPQIQYLNMANCQWEENSLLTILSATQKNHALKWMNCVGCKMNDQHAQCLADIISANPLLEQLNLAYCALSNGGLTTVFKTLYHLRQLRYLDFNTNQLSDAVIAMLAQVVSANQLEHLNLSHCSLGANCIVVLTAVSNNGTLQYLDLSYNDISDDEASCVASAITNNKYLRHINLASNKFRNQSIKTVLNAMVAVNSLQHVDLSSYSISDKLAILLENVALNNSSLETVLLYEYTICEVKEHLPTSISKLSVKHICINDHDFSDSEAIALEAVINNSSSICHLDIANSVIPDSSKLKIIRAMRKHLNLMHLNLNGYSVTKDVAKELTPILSQNTKLQHLEMIECGLTDDFLFKLSQSVITHNKLLHLKLSENIFSSKAVASLMVVLSKTTTLDCLEMASCGLNGRAFLNDINTLTFLNLRDNHISDSDARNVANFINANTKLQYLDLSNCAMNTAGILVILKVIKGITNLRLLNLASNHILDHLELVSTEIVAVVSCNKGIEYLYLPQCQFDDKSMTALFDVLQLFSSFRCVGITYYEMSKTLCNHMKSLLTSNKMVTIRIDKLVISQRLLNQLCDVLPQFRTQHISFYQCCISDEQLCQLCPMVSNNADIYCFSIIDSVFGGKQNTFSTLFKSLCHSAYFFLKELNLRSFSLTDKNQTTNVLVPTLVQVISANHLQVLKLSECLQGVNRSDLLTAIANTVTLQYLDLSYNDISDDEASCVAYAITNNEYLCHINLASNEFGDQSIKSVFNAMVAVNSLQHVDLSSYSIFDDLAILLENVALNNSSLETVLLYEYTIREVKEHLPTSISKLSVKHICISDHDFSDSEAIALETVINNSSSICHFDIANSVIPDSNKLKIIRGMSKHFTLTHLNINSIFVTEEMEDELVNFVAQNSGLRHIEMAGCGLSEKFLIAIARALDMLMELMHLNLSCNTLTAMAVTEISYVLSNMMSLQDLIISGCGLQNISCLNVIKALCFLDLSDNPISDLCAGNLANFIAKNKTVQNLNLSSCNLNSRGLYTILRAFKRLNNLKQLNLASNHISNNLKSITAEIATIITSNKCIECMYLPHGQFHEGNLITLFEAMKTVSSLKCVDIGCSKMSSTLWTLVRAVFVHNRELNDFRIAKLMLSQAKLDELCDILPKVKALHVSLSHCWISEMLTSQLCKMFFNNEIMSHFSIDDCRFSKHFLGISNLFKSLQHTRCLNQICIKDISFVNDEFNHSNIASVIKANSGIKILKIVDCRIPDYELSKVFRASSDLRDLQIFSLDNVNFSEDAHVTDALKSKISLKFINFLNCKLQNKTVMLVCVALKSISSLIHINLSGNNITNEAAKLLADAITNNTFLEHLELENCNLLEEGMQSVCDSIQLRTLKTLNLSYNCITDQIADDLAYAITSKSCIEILLVKNCSLKVNGITAIISALEKINSVRYLDLSYNRLTNVYLGLAAVIDSNVHLENLHLSCCNIREWMKTKPSSLNELFFIGNNISTTAAVCMKNSLSKVKKLCRLSLSKCHLQEAQLKILLGKNMEHSLTYLDLSFNTISCNIATILSKALCDNFELQYLSLSHCELNENGLSYILDAIKSTRMLTYLDLSFNPISDMLAGKIANLISGNNNLKHLSLSNCVLQEVGFISIADALTNTALSWLDISFNSITSRIASELSLCKMFIVKSKLRCLNLNNCQWQGDSLEIMLNTIVRLENLKCISLSGCKINYKEAKIVASFVSSSNAIEQLILENCSITPARIERILVALKQVKTMKHLNLSKNQIPEKAISFLVRFITGNKIEQIEFSHCSLGVGQFSEFLLAIANNVRTLQYLDLSYNDISDDEASCVASAITNNEYLYHVNLTNNHFSSSGIQIILNAMAVIHSLKFVHLGSYDITDELADDVVAVAISNPALEVIMACSSKTGIPCVKIEKVRVYK